MASQGDFLAPGPGPRVRALDAESAFFARYASGLALFILFGFAQFELRGLAPFGRFGWEIHAHAAAMTGWLALSVAQPWLAASGNRALHRRLGWIAVTLLGIIPIVGSLAGVAALRDGIVPPFFTPAYFLALVHVGVLSFTAMVIAAVVLRRRSDWHRRLMLGSTVLILEPAFGRLLPMPLLGNWGEWVAMAGQLGALGFLVRHDRRSRGQVHPATLIVAGAVVAVHIAIELLAVSAPVRALAASIAAG